MSKGKLINYAKTGKRKQADEIEELHFKKQDDENHIYDAVMQDLSDDYLTYINDLVKATKTPIKDKLSREKLDIKQNNKDLKQNDQIQFRQQKKSTSRRKKDETIESSIYEKINLKKEEQKPRFFNIPQQHHTEKSESTNALRFLRDSEIIEAKRHKTTKEQEEDSNFIDNINEYITYLQSDHHHQQQKRTLYQQRMARIDELASQNKKLKRQLSLYKQKFKEIQLTLEVHENHLKNRERQYKNKIKQLNNALINAVKKINEQKQEIEELQSFMYGFTNQVAVYTTEKQHKSRLRHLLVHNYLIQKGQKENIKEKQPIIQENLLKSFNSQELKMQQIMAKANLVNKDFQRGAISSDQNSEDQGLSKIMNTTSVLPASRLQSKKIMHKLQISKSRSKQSKNGKYHKNIQSVAKPYRFKQSDSDSQ